MAERIGLDTSSEAYWRVRTDAYLAQLEGPYHRHRMAMIQRLLEGVPVEPDGVVDFGCGDGVLLEPFIDDPGELVGIDIDPGMLTAAQARLGNRARLEVGGVERLADVPDASADLMLSLNVNAYLSPTDDQAFYMHTARILRPGGMLVITHSNRLFDLYALNGFTASFIASELCGGVDGAGGVAELLVNAERFKEDTSSGHFQIRENPLAFPAKLAGYDLAEEQQEFANLHPLPPALMQGARFDDIDSREYQSTLDWTDAERWKLRFICSMFGSRSVRR